MGTHWKRLVNMDYLGAYSIDGKDKLLTIKSVGNEMVTGNNGKREECIVAHFAENEKPMILNRTNCKTISKLHNSPEIEDWVGKKVQIFATTTKVAGEQVECLRIRDYIKAAEKIHPCADCGKEIQASGSMTAESIAQYGLNTYGVKLCIVCGKARKQLADQQKAEQSEQESGGQE